MNDGEECYLKKQVGRRNLIEPVFMLDPRKWYEPFAATYTIGLISTSTLIQT